MRSHHTDAGYARRSLLHLPPAADARSPCSPQPPPPPRWAEVCAHLTFETAASLDVRPLAWAADSGVALIAAYIWDDDIHLWSWIEDSDGGGDRRASWVHAGGPGTLPGFRWYSSLPKMMNNCKVISLGNGVRRRHLFSTYAPAVVRRCDALVADLEAGRVNSIVDQPLPAPNPAARARQISALRAAAATLRDSAQQSIARGARAMRLRRRVNALARAARFFLAPPAAGSTVTLAAAGADGVVAVAGGSSCDGSIGDPDADAKARARAFAVPLVAAFL